MEVDSLLDGVHLDGEACEPGCCSSPSIMCVA